MSGGGVGVGVVVGDQFPIFDPESKFGKKQMSPYICWRVLVTNFKLLILSCNLVKTKFPYICWVGRGGVLVTNFKLLILSLNLLKPNFQLLADQLLMLSPKLPKPKFPHSLHLLRP